MKFILLTVLVLVAAAQSRKLPENLKACPRNHPNYVECLKKTIEKGRPYIEKGIPKIRLPAGDPLNIPQLVIDRSTDAVQIKATLTDIVAIGGSKFIIQDIKADVPKMEGEITVLVPKVQASNNYDIKGRMLALNLEGKGKMTGEFTDTKITIFTHFKKVERKGKAYFQIDNIKSKIRLGGARIKLVEVDERNQQAADAAVQFFHQNTRQTLDLVAPIIDETASEIIQIILNQILEVVPAEELLPEN